MAAKKVDRDDDDATQADTAVAEGAEAEVSRYKMSLDVNVENAGPCKKHIRVKVPRQDIEHYYGEAIGEMEGNAAVPGFRVGHVPKKLLERRFKKEIADQVKQTILFQSLEQIAEDQELDPINEPNLDVAALEIPEEGDFEYEFDVEVRPEFDLPNYKGLKIKRPVRDVTDEEVESNLQRYLAQYSRLVPYEGAAEKNDYIVADVEFLHKGERLHKIREETIQLRPVLRFYDAEVDNFDGRMKGVKAGETREIDITVSTEASRMEYRGESLKAVFHVHDVKRAETPELNSEMLERFGVESEDDLRKQVREMLERQVRYQQRQQTRAQVLEKITASADWDLPEQLVRRQTDNALRREILEMQQAGFSRQDVQARENELRQKAITTTRQALKEHFVLDKIATQENIETEPQDIESEILMMALQSGENPRRVRSRLQKSGLIENLDAQLRERKTVDFIIEHAKFEDVKSDAPVPSRVEAVPHSVCGLTTDAAPEPELDDADAE